ncbi:MAG: hypothetical protein Ct9H300mP9_5660 [Candidatus Neomarinimicrobiota bacterium]|nr:MAG: hypothetical protein Ct9H300mP9_5660 [Candidatus Neomarinimicrobiota bacterium]
MVDQQQQYYIGDNMEPRSEILEQYQRECSPEEYQEIRQLYKDHSIAKGTEKYIGPAVNPHRRLCLYITPGRP